MRHRVSATTLARIGQQRVMEADGVLVILAALGRTFEEFTKRSGPHTTAAYAPVTPVDRAGVLRFDAPAVHDALALRKAARGLTWRAVAEEIGLARPANLTRLARGGRLTVPGIVHIAEWLGRAPETLTAPADW